MNTLHKTLHVKHLHALVGLIALVGGAGLHAAAVTCSVNSLALNFPIYDASDPFPTDSVGSVDVQCTNLDTSASSGVSVAVSMSAGNNGTVSDRKLAGNGNLLRYGIYSDATRTNSWGQGMDAVQHSSGTLAPNQAKVLHYTLFGRIPAQQNVVPGIYQDLVVLTITP